METQPQLLLLQKSMLISEGVGRTLSPDANMWFLAQPLIESWIEKNLGPTVIFTEATKEITNSLKRLPRIIANIEKHTAIIIERGLKLHPDTIREISRQNRPTLITYPKPYMLIIFVLIILLFLT
jgi:ubiquinone biosynthesis protein